jgi:two-component system, OmpR family, heavy metal sensor histidine kinase CusS
MKSIGRRLTIALVLLCCALWGLGSGAAYLAMRAGLIAEFDRAHTTDLSSLSSMAEQSEAGLKFDATGEYMPNFQRETNGTVLYRSASLLDLPDLPRKSGTLTAPRTWNVTLLDGLPGRAAGVRFVPNEDEDTPRRPGSPPLKKAVILVAAFHRQSLDERLRLLGSVLLFAGVAMAIATVASVGLAVRHGLRPLAALAERAVTIDASSLQLRFPTDEMPTELSPIAQRLNDLFVRLESSFARERQFSADVAHELKTPIAELRTLAEVTLRLPDDPAAAQSALQDALAIALQMEAIATGLMALAHCEARLTDLNLERVPLRDLVRETSQSLAGRAREKKLDLQIAIPPESCWWTDRAILRSIITNLLANAIEYGQAETSIRVELSPNGAADLLRVSNRNHDLTPEDLAHLFERFWRKDRARSSSEHSGLGLAVARAYSESLGLKLEASLKRPEVVFTLWGARRCPEASTR